MTSIAGEGLIGDKNARVLSPSIIEKAKDAAVSINNNKNDGGIDSDSDSELSSSSTINSILQKFNSIHCKIGNRYFALQLGHQYKQEFVEFFE